MMPSLSPTMETKPAPAAAFDSSGSGTIAPRNDRSASSTGEPRKEIPAFCSGRTGLASRVRKKPGTVGVCASVRANSTSWSVIFATASKLPVASGLSASIFAIRAGEVRSLSEKTMSKAIDDAPASVSAWVNRATSVRGHGH